MCSSDLRGGAKATHLYRLSNGTRSAVRLLEVANLKPCCGRVRIDHEEIPPGGAGEVEVVLMLENKAGDLNHVAVVTTSRGETIELKTTATVHPAVRIQPIEPSPSRAVSGSGRTEEVRFLAIAAGTLGDPPLDLGHMELGSTIPARWCDSEVSRTSTDGVETAARPLAVRLDAGGPPGARAAELAFRIGGEIVHRSAVNWTVVPPITASPESIALGPKMRSAKVVLDSQDGLPFRVGRASCKEPAVTGHAEVDEPAGRHTIQVESTAGAPVGVHILTIETDHPSLPRVELRIVVLD